MLIYVRIDILVKGTETSKNSRRVAKFESKVASRRTTKIGNLVVLDIFLVALILIPYNMRFVLSSENGICLLEKERVRIKTSKNLYEQLFSKRKSKKYLVVRRTTRSQFLVVLTQFLVVEDTRTRKFCYPEPLHTVSFNFAHILCLTLIMYFHFYFSPRKEYYSRLCGKSFPLFVSISY